MHQIYMDRCLELAAVAAGQQESAVGSIVVKNGEIIGEGYEMSRRLKDVTRHAEMVAILDAVQKHGSCEGATLYTNVEPCILCAYAIRHYKLAEVVYAEPCGELGGASGLFRVLTSGEISSWPAPPAVTVIGV
jgi:tRNA(Arg) A34 adenosine deaminase TadA